MTSLEKFSQVKYPDIPAVCPQLGSTTKRSAKTRVKAVLNAIDFIPRFHLFLNIVIIIDE